MINLPEKVTILGTGLFAEDCPEDDFIIAINYAFKIKTPNVIFNMHRFNLIGLDEYIKNKNMFVVDLKNYPFKDIFDKYKVSFFNSSIDYVLAYCLLNNVKEIDIYGIQLNTPQETNQRYSFYFWVGYLTSQNIKINLHKSTLNFNQDHLYGFNN
jgi:hypothetical protein